MNTAAGLCVMLTAMAQTSTPAKVRIATFNIWELSAAKLGRGDAENRGADPQLRKAAEIIQRIRPDVLLVNEIDFDAEQRTNAAAFRDRYLKVSQNGQEPVDYPHVFFAPVNTGVPSGFDLDNDGDSRGPADAFGYGRYPGQYGMALLSRYPIEAEQVRTFQKLLWKDLPHNLLPDGREGKPAWYSPEEAEILRLSSKSHWDVPVRIGPLLLHVLAAHPTPPVFDGPEDRNGRRAFDEVRLLADYLTGGATADSEVGRYIVDDNGVRGGLPSDAPFVLLGDMNADPAKDEKPYGRSAISQLLDHPRVQDPAPKSPGAAADPASYPGDKSMRTCDFGRIDYVLPSRDLKVVESGVFWPGPDDPQRGLVEAPDPASDHRLVWVDLAVPAGEPR